jgi:hypothetical protein
MTQVSSLQLEQMVKTRAVERITRGVLQTYNDPKILQKYKNDREKYKITEEQKRVGRCLWQAPNYYVYFFLKQLFEPHFGKHWMFAKQVLIHDYVRPWLLVPLKEVL